MGIRVAIIDDLDKIVQFNYNLSLEIENKILDIESLTIGVRALIEDYRKGGYYIYEKDEEIIGQIMYIYEWSDWKNGNFLWLHNIYVDMNHRNKGVFSEIYNYIVEKYHDDNSIVGIRLNIENNNNIAQNISEKFQLHRYDYSLCEYIKK